MPYLEQPAPERLLMTAGKSVLEGPDTKDIKDPLESLDQMLVKRLTETSQVGYRKLGIGDTKMLYSQLSF